MRKLILSIFLCSALSGAGMAQSRNDSLYRVFELGEVSITGKKGEGQEVSIFRSDILKQSHHNISESLQDLPGIVFSSAGSRNESSVTIRGFDSRQVALLVDGIPVYISYDGNIDLSRFLSWNYEKISVSRGFTSLLYGPNTMGGAINLVSSKPVNPVEADFYTGITAGNRGYNGNVQNLKLGIKKGRFFLQTGISRFDQDEWDLSKKFKPDYSQPSGSRMNSSESDLNFSFRAGMTTDRQSEYTIGYNRQEGSKGIPVYDGENQVQRFWQMPDWDKESISLISKTIIHPGSYLTTRLYFDRFFNQLRSFDDSTYTSQNFRYAFNSIYDDYSAGSNFIYHLALGSKNQISASFNFKRDIHNEKSDDEYPFIRFSDNMYSLALEDVWKMSELFEITGGASWNLKGNTGAEEYIQSTNSIGSMESGVSQKFNFRLGGEYNQDKLNKFWASWSANSRFATLKERYSYRLGRSIPNPELGPERAIHLILGYGRKGEYLSLNAEGFYILSKDKIVYSNVEPAILQYQNVERSLSYGTDILLNMSFANSYSTGICYSYLKIKNPDNPDFYFIDIPEHSIRLFARAELVDRLILNINYRYSSSRYSYTDASYETEGYGILDTGMDILLPARLSLKLSVLNLTDRNYFYSDGYPARGRNFRIGLRYRFDS